MSFNMTLHLADQWRRLIVQEVPRGWEVREEHDHRIVRQVCYTDWHRVERAVSVFKRQAFELERQGWMST